MSIRRWRTSSSRFGDWNYFLRKWIVLGTLLAAVATGLSQTYLPFLGPAILITVAFLPLVLVADDWALVLLIVALPLYSRLLVALGAPALLIHAHYGVALIIFLRLLIVYGSERMHPAVRRSTTIFLGFSLLLAVTIALSALQGGIHGFRPILVFLTLTEPFVVLAFMLSMDDAHRSKMRRLLIILASTQLPFAAYQAAQFGFSDHVQGTLLNQGAGAHVVAGACTIAALLLIDGSRNWIVPRVLLATGFLSVGIASDAKQVYSALIAAGAILAPRFARSSAKWLAGIAALLVILFLLGSAIYPPLGKVVDRSLASSYGIEKWSYVEIAYRQQNFSQQLLGAGPGNGASRVALLSIPGYGNVPGALVGTEPAQLALDLLTQNKDRWATVGSSANSPFLSWLSVYSDLGLIGLLIYLLLALWAWRTLQYCLPSERTIGQLLLVFAAILGLIYTWLEEPVFVLFLAIAIGSFRRSYPPEAIQTCDNVVKQLRPFARSA